MKEIFCDQCGRKLGKKRYHLQGKELCTKHARQLSKHGKFLDDNPRDIHDLNDYHFIGDKCVINIYNQNNIKVEECIIDIEDLPKVKYSKWRMKEGHVVTGIGQRIHVIGDYILNHFNTAESVVCNVNGNFLDNRKRNLITESV